jgi:Brp/Blh family beta-carotene 15,15'-monooxygenase
MRDDATDRAAAFARPCLGNGASLVPNDPTRFSDTMETISSWHSGGVTALFCVLIAAHLIVGSLDLLVWPTLASALILCLGVPHGAADIAVIERTWHLTRWGETALALVAYLLLAGGVLLVWWLQPELSLALFLIGSAYHFGGDWGHHPPARMLRGAAMLIATTIFHEGQVIEIFGWLATPKAGDDVVAAMVALSGPIIVSAVFCALSRVRTRPRAALEYGATLAMAMILPPITFFILYFCLLHSPRHMLTIRTVLADWPLPRLLTTSAPYALMAIAGTLLGATLLSSLHAAPALLSAVFIALAALTVPHMLLAE